MLDNGQLPNYPQVGSGKPVLQFLTQIQFCKRKEGCEFLLNVTFCLHSFAVHFLTPSLVAHTFYERAYTYPIPIIIYISNPIVTFLVINPSTCSPRHLSRMTIAHANAEWAMSWLRGSISLSVGKRHMYSLWRNVLYGVGHVCFILNEHCNTCTKM